MGGYDGGRIQKQFGIRPADYMKKTNEKEL